MIENSQTAGEISKTLGITTATLRNYVKHFGQHLSPDAARKTRKRFTADDLQTLKVAKTLLDDGLTYDQVSEQLEILRAQCEVIDDFQPENQPEDIPQEEETPSAIQSIEFFSQIIDQLTEEHKTALQAKDSHIESLEKNQDRLQKEISWLRLPWYKKLFRDPPE